MEENKSGKELALKALSVVISLVFTIFLVELGAGKYLLNKNNKKVEKCGQDHLSEFTGSRAFSLKNAHYRLGNEVRHCDFEYDYVYHINKDGLRVSLGDNKQDVKREILAVGDSFTFGFGVEDEEAFPALLGAYNAGLWGDPFDTQVKSLKRNVELFEPKTVVWGIYPSHLITMTKDAWEKNCPGDAVYLSGNFPLSKLFGRAASWIMNTSSIGRLIMKKNFIKNIEYREGGLHVDKDCYQTKEVILYDRNIKSNTYTDTRNVNESFPGDLDEIYDKLGKYFVGAKNISEEKEINILFFIIPSRMQLRLKEGSLNLPYEGADIDPDLPVERISKLIMDAGFSESSIVDLSGYFLEEGDWAQYYYEIDAHWNTKGHEFVAKVLKNIIMNQPQNSAQNEDE